MCVKPHSNSETATLRSIEMLTTRIAGGAPTSQDYLERGRAYKQVARLHEAIADLTRALETAPPLPLEDQAMAYNLRGMAYRRLGNYPAAIADTTRSVELNPGLASLWADRGWALTCGGQPKQAMRDFAHAIELYPYFLAYIYRGVAHFIMGNYPAALADYDRVIELYPTQIAYNSYLNRAILRLLVHGDTHGAEADLDVAIARNPDAIKPSPRPYAYRGLVRALQGRAAEALADLAVGEHLGNDLMTPLARGYARCRQGESQAMREEVTRFLDNARAEGLTVEYGLQIAGRFMTNPLSAIPSLLPLVA
ncbi:MAG: hypothetical protein Fur0022_20780 [Anaerolineales bacterium]